MGLFSFATDIGRKLFNKEDEAPEKIKAHIEADNPGVNNLEVTVSDGIVSLTAAASSAEALEKAVLMAGNVKGVSEVKTEGFTAPQQPVRFSITRSWPVIPCPRSLNNTMVRLLLM